MARLNTNEFAAAKESIKSMGSSDSSLWFQDVIPSAKYPAEAGRYVVYVFPGCPWAQRANIAHKLKGLGSIVQMVTMDGMEPGKGWCFSGEARFGYARDPVFGYKYLRDIYARAAPHYDGRPMIPTLLDRKTGTIVSNDSGKIIRMFYEAFDHLLLPQYQEINKGASALLPRHLSACIDEFNAFVYNTINNGVYKIGFATGQKSYNENMQTLFHGLDRIEEHLTEPGHSPYLFGNHITDADIRLFPTIVRFDIVYHTLFKCNWKMIRYDYPRIHDWMRRLYWQDDTAYAFQETTFPQIIKQGYARAVGESIVPLGPVPDVMPL